MNKRSSWTDHLPTRGEEHFIFRTLAAVTLLGAAGSAFITASLDAANIGNLVEGRDAVQRPWWLHTYSVAVVTCIVAAMALWSKSLGRSTMLRVVYGVTAVLNASVPVLGRSQDGLSLLLPGLHLGLAGLLVGLAIMADPDPRLNDQIPK